MINFHRRYDVLEQLSFRLLPLIVNILLQTSNDSQLDAYSLFDLILLGYQHAPTLALSIQDKLPLLWTHFHATLFQPAMVRTIACLIEIHRGVVGVFEDLESVPERPIMSSVLHHLSTVSWYEKKRPFPWIEGKWVPEDDEAQGQRSFNLRYDKRCLGKAFKFDLEDKSTWNGFIYRPKEADDGVYQGLGHWYDAMDESNAANSSTIEWNCRTCTMKNSTMNKKCTACEAPAPLVVAQQGVRKKRPFTIRCTPDGNSMLIQSLEKIFWCRKSQTVKEFDFQQSKPKSQIATFDSRQDAIMSLQPVTFQTLEVWIYPMVGQNGSSEQVIVAHDNLQLIFTPDCRVGMKRGDVSSELSPTLVQNEWIHVVLTCECTLYLNGKRVVEMDPVKGPLSTMSRLLIGGTMLNDQNFQGAMHQLCIYSTCWTENQVTEQYDNPDLSRSDSIGSWPLTDLFDRSMASNHGILLRDWLCPSEFLTLEIPIAHVVLNPKWNHLCQGFQWTDSCIRYSHPLVLSTMASFSTTIALTRPTSVSFQMDSITVGIGCSDTLVYTIYINIGTVPYGRFQSIQSCSDNAEITLAFDLVKHWLAISFDQEALIELAIPNLQSETATYLQLHGTNVQNWTFRSELVTKTAPSSPEAPMTVVEAAPIQSEWQCIACTVFNPVDRTTCSVCGTLHAEEWTCSACTMSNSSARTLCHMCSSPKPPPPVVVAMPVPVVEQVDDDDIIDIEGEWEVVGTQSVFSLTFGTNQPQSLDLITGDDGLEGLKHSNCQFDGRIRDYIAFELTLNATHDRMHGFWYSQQIAGEWNLQLIMDYDQVRPLFYSGLINMKDDLINVCYQNSFLQALFMTYEFRTRFLTEPRPSNGFFQALYDVFKKLLVSQRPAFGTKELQVYLPFEKGVQQDASDFAHFIMDQLPKNPEFGGELETTLTCTECHESFSKKEYFWELLLNMIDVRHTPITHIRFLSGTNSTLNGFERLTLDLDPPRRLYLCIKRSEESNLVPITNLSIVSDNTPPVGYERVDGSTFIRNLFYARHPRGSPITDLNIMTTSSTIPDGFVKLDTPLLKGFFLSYRHDMPIRDVQLEPTLETTDAGSKRCLTGIRLGNSTSSDDSWSLLGQLRDQDVWIQRGHGNPIYSLDLIQSPDRVPKFQDYEVLTVREDPNTCIWKSVKEGKQVVELQIGETIEETEAVEFEGYYTAFGGGKVKGVWIDKTQQMFGYCKDSRSSSPQPLDQVTGQEKRLMGGNFEAAKQAELMCISDIQVLRPEDPVPLGYSRIHDCICIQRSRTAIGIVSVGVFYSNIETLSEDMIPLLQTIDGFPAKIHPTLPIVLYTRKGDASKALVDLFVTPNASMEHYTTIRTSKLGMSGDLNQDQLGPAAYLSYLTLSGREIVPDHDLNGLYSLWGGTLHLLATCKINYHRATGRFGPSLDQLTGTLTGFVTSSRMYYDSCCVLQLNESQTEAEGWDTTGPWSIIKDTYGKLVYKRDYGTEWTNGTLTSTERVSRHDIQTMLNRLGAIRTLGGENRFECPTCGDRTETKTQSRVSTCPNHLILTLKRIWFDWKTQTAHKSLHDITIPSTVVVEGLIYGLYALIVHSGVSAQSGHYYTFARDSRRCEYLQQDESPHAPWLKFNDTKISLSSWNEIKTQSDSIYLLFYKKLNSPMTDRVAVLTNDEGSSSNMVASSTAAFQSTLYRHLVTAPLLQS